MVRLASARRGVIWGSKRVALAEILGVLANGGLDIGIDARDIVVADEGDEALELVGVAAAGIENLHGGGDDAIDALLHGRHGEDADVHEVIAIQRRIEGEGRGVADMAGERLDVVDQLRVLGEAVVGLELGPLGFERLPLGAHGLDPGAGVVVILETLLGVLELFAVLLAGLFDGGEGVLDLILGGGDFGLQFLLAGLVTLDEGAVGGDLAQKIGDGPQERSAVLLKAGNVHVFLERLEGEEGEDADGEDKGDDDEDNFLPEAEISQELCHK